MATNQYLFRLHHNPITGNHRGWNAFLNDEIIVVENQAEFHHTDFLVSLPETSPDLIRQANMLAHASAIITAHCEIWCITVFQLSSEKDADNTTPVIVLHPYREFNLAPEDTSDEPDQRYFPTFNYSGAAPPDAYSHEGRLGSGFYSYFLHIAPLQNALGGPPPDPWMVVNIARSVESGRPQQQWLKKALDWTDFFLSKHKTLTLHANGTLARTRFPLWQAAIESLPHGHSGYSVNRQGRVSAQPKALRARVLNGVSNMAQQRRMYMRRDWAISAVVREWHITCKKLMAWFYWNDRHGWQTHQGFYWGNYQSGSYGELAGTDVPWQYLSRNLQFVIDFLNLINVAQGDHGLIISVPGRTTQELENDYQIILNKLRDPDGVVHRYAVSNVTTHHQMLRHAVALVTRIMDEVINYRTLWAQWEQTPAPEEPAQQLQHAADGVAIMNDFALQWAGLVADFYSVLCLLMTWELTWEPAEPSRAASVADTIRSKQYPYASKWQTYFTYENKQQPPTNLDFSNGFGASRPEFVPYRLWEIVLYETGFTDQDAELQAQQRQEARDAFHAQLAEQAYQRYLANEARMDAYIEEWKAELQRRDAPNPDDVWDYRNYSSLQWWKEKSQEQINVEFALRAINIPDELLNPGALGVGLLRNYVPSLSRFSDQNGWNESIKPTGNGIDRLVRDHATVLTRRYVDGVPTIVAVEVIGNAAGDLADYLGTNDETYSPRQFWPPLDVLGDWF
jgi:hypothetical protein